MHSRTYTHSLTHTHTHTHTHSHIHSHTETHALTHTLTHTETLSLTHALTHALTLILTHTHTHTHTPEQDMLVPLSGVAISGHNELYPPVEYTLRFYAEANGCDYDSEGGGGVEGGGCRLFVAFPSTTPTTLPRATHCVTAAPTPRCA